MDNVGGGLEPLNRGCVRDRSGCENNGVRGFGFDEAGRHFPALDDSCAGALGLAREIGDDATEFRAARQSLRDERLTAETGLTLVERNIVTAFG